MVFLVTLINAMEINLLTGNMGFRMMIVKN